MKPNFTPWEKLVASARTEPESLDRQAPSGFSTRVVALANSAKNQAVADSVFARISWPALGVATLAAIVAVAANLQPVMNSLSDDVSALSEPVADAADTSA